MSLNLNTDFLIPCSNLVLKMVSKCREKTERTSDGARVIGPGNNETDGEILYSASGESSESNCEDSGSAGIIPNLQGLSGFTENR